MIGHHDLMTRLRREGLTHRELIGILQDEGLDLLAYSLVWSHVGRIEHTLFYDTWTENDEGIFRLPKDIDDLIADDFTERQLDWDIRTRIEILWEEDEDDYDDGD